MNILITGARGYIASHLNQALSAGGHNCAAASVRGGVGGLTGLSGYDAVIHCAALVHSNDGDPDHYCKINTELTAALAQKAKQEGVSRFIFMSTMAVYGIDDSLCETAVISGNTPVNPRTPYGKSKLAAKDMLKEMACEHFHVYILRLPMVYGAGAPGNYGRLCRLVKWAPVFPKVENRRSMISIENLQGYVASLLDTAGQDEKKGAGYVSILRPQDPSPVCTSDLAVSIAAGYGKRLYLSPLLGRIVLLFPIEPVRKMFGSLVYQDS